MPKIRLSLLSLLLVLVLAGPGLAQQYIPDPDVYGKIKGAYQPIGLVAQHRLRQRPGRLLYQKQPPLWLRQQGDPEPKL